MSKKIVVMDSGIGGASILKEIAKKCPNEKYIYFADTLNSPYGEKSKKELFKILKKNIDNLNKKNDIKLLVLACNTASSLCGKELRKIYKFPIICVEPAIKVAAEKGYKNIAILATPQTLKTNKTIKNYKKMNNLKIKKVPLKNLAKIIDCNVKNIKLVFPYIKECLNGLKCDCVVVGCTHYNFVKEQIKEALNCEIISCEKAVALQAKKVLANLEKFKTQSKTKPKIKIILSKRNFKIHQFLKHYLNSSRS